MRERSRLIGPESSVMSGLKDGSSLCGSTSELASGRRESGLVALLTSRRWDRWAGVCRLKGMDMEECQKRHEEAVLQLLRLGVTMREMREKGLDDPRLTAEERLGLCQSH